MNINIKGILTFRRINFNVRYIAHKNHSHLNWLHIYDGYDEIGRKISGKDYFGTDKFRVVGGRVKNNILEITMFFGLYKKEELNKILDSGDPEKIIIININ
jgi:hypothetical protein